MNRNITSSIHNDTVEIEKSKEINGLTNKKKEII